MAMQDLRSFVEDRGTFEVVGVTFAITELTYEPTWGRSVGYDGRAHYSLQPFDVRLEARGISLVTAPIAPVRPVPPPLMRWANIRPGRPWEAIGGRR